MNLGEDLFLETTLILWERENYSTFGSILVRTFGQIHRAPPNYGYAPPPPWRN